ncbi:MAG: DUF4242 domain-containing protein [Phycisphaerales bacterium]|jgi:hypothetical protein|nr:DUF4242 domain-containing protein [Phycisphaerales bacterium]
MRQFVIERDMPGIGSADAKALGEGSRKSCSVLRDLGPDIQWVHSYVTQDRIYCVYRAESESLIREHAARSGFPASKITEVRAIIDPTTGAAA